MSIGHQAIIDLIPPHSRVLDVGCGDGKLLAKLATDKQVKGYGIDFDPDNIVSCIKRGLSVYHGDIDDGLKEVLDQSYDFVILSHTLQQVKNPLYVISEMLRVGKTGIVSFPNIAHWQARLDLSLGQPPQTKSLPYNWYDTPNIRVISIKGFRQLCQEHNFKIKHEIPLYQSSAARKILPRSFSNFFCEKGLFVLEKGTLDDISI